MQDASHAERGNAVPEDCTNKRSVIEHSYVRYLDVLLSAEVEEREHRAQRRLKEAQLAESRRRSRSSDFSQVAEGLRPNGYENWPKATT